MTIPTAISVRSIELIGDDYKPFVEPYIIEGKRFPARLDVLFQDNPVVSLIFPETTPDTFEGILSRALWALSTFRGTTIHFVHRAEIAISSTMSEDQLQAEANACMCVYDCSFLHISGSVFPYTFNPGDAVVDWGQPTQENIPIKESEMLKTFMYVAAQLNIPLADAQSYADWLTKDGYEVQFHEPYTYENISYQSN